MKLIYMAVLLVPSLALADPANPPAPAPGGLHYRCVAESQFRERYESSADDLRAAQEEALALCQSLSFHACRIVACGKVH